MLPRSCLQSGILVMVSIFLYLGLLRSRSITFHWNGTVPTCHKSILNRSAPSIGPSILSLQSVRAKFEGSIQLFRSIMIATCWCILHCTVSSFDGEVLNQPKECSYILCSPPSHSRGWDWRLLKRRRLKWKQRQVEIRLLIHTSTIHQLLLEESVLYARLGRLAVHAASCILNGPTASLQPRRILHTIQNESTTRKLLQRRRSCRKSSVQGARPLKRSARMLWRGNKKL